MKTALNLKVFNILRWGVTRVLLHFTSERFCTIQPT